MARFDQYIYATDAMTMKDLYTSTFYLFNMENH